MSKYLTPADLRNPLRKSGYDHVGTTSFPQQIIRGEETYRAHGPRTKVPGKKFALAWRGPIRNTAYEAAQDYCDYANGLPVAQQQRPLRNAGHSAKPRNGDSNKHPKRLEAERLLREAKADEDESDDGSGYVYLIGEEGCKSFCKIGKCRDEPQYRLAGLQTGNPRKLILLGSMQTDDRHTTEKELHQKYHPLNVLQEWFRLDAGILSAFANGKDSE